MYVQALHLRLIGYISLAIVLTFILLGFVTRRSGWAWAGALVLFLPVFGQFALSMFFLSGLGMLRVGWLPFMDISFEFLNLGQVAFLPYRILIWFFSLFDCYARDFLAWLFMAIGALIFVWGVLTWLQTRFGKVGVATSCLYRISRHPQYLGWILKAPMRMIIRKERPDKRREVAWVLLLYTGIFMGLSLFWVDLGGAWSRQEQMAIENPQKMIDSLLAEINQTESMRKVSGHFTAFRPLGEAAVDPMINMLSDDWEVNREFAAMILGDIPSQRAVPHLILSLDDPDQRVRNQAAWSLGNTGTGTEKRDMVPCYPGPCLPCVD